MFFENYSLNASIIVVLLAALTFDYITKFFKYWYVRHIPHGIPIPGFGTDYARILGLKTTTELVTKLYEKYPDDKFVGCIKGRIPDLIVRDPGAAQTILTTDSEHFSRKGLCLEKSADVCLSNDLFYAEGEKWKLLRDMTESFLKYYTWKLNWINNDVPTYDGEVNMHKEVSNFLDKLMTINFFTTEDSKSEGKQLISKVRAKLQKPSLIDRFQNYIMVIFPLLHVKFGLKCISGIMMNSLKNYADTLIIRKFIDYKSFVESYQKNKKELRVEIPENELTMSFLCSFISNGYIPVYNVVTAMLYELSKNVEIQDKARNTAVSQWNDILDFHVNEKNFLDDIISETMRMYPPYAVLNRVCTKTYKFAECGTLIDKGVTITIPLASIQRDNKYHQRAQMFDPSRFSSEVTQEQHVSSYIPFGEGPRKCVGEKLSRWMIRVTVAALLRNHRLEKSSRTPSELKFVDSGHGRRPKNDLWLKMTPINTSTI